MKEYKLTGFLNMFDIVPDFVYPIFQCDDIYYFQEGNNDKIDSFVPVKSAVYPMVHKISDYEKIIGFKNETNTVNSRPLYAFQVKDNEVFCGNAEMILEFFDTYSTDNTFLKEEIEDFKKELYILPNLEMRCNVFFSNKKMEYEKNWNSRLFLHWDNDERPLTLADTFIMPNFRLQKANDRIGFSYNDTLDTIIDKFVDYEKTSTMLLLGVPGIGKSSMVSWIANKYKEDNRFIVLKFRDWESEELEYGLLESICNTLQCKKKDLEGRILILDGFDEIRLFNIRENILDTFFNDILNFRNIKCLITSRPNYVYSEYFECVVNLLPFSINNINEFYYKMAGIELNQIKKFNYDLLEVLGIPVILYMVTMSNIDISESATKPELYNNIFAENNGIFDKFLCGEIAYDTNLYMLRNDNIKLYTQFLKVIAFRMFENDNLIVKAEDYAIPQLCFQGKKINILFPLKFLIQNTEYIEFINKSIYEFFVSEYIFMTIYEAVNKNKEYLAGIFGKMFKSNILSKEILEFLKYKIRNSKLNDIHDTINETFQLMLRDGMTFYTNECYKNVIKCEMYVFANMLEIIHLWDNINLKFDNSISQYMNYNFDFDICFNLEGVSLSKTALKGVNLREANLKGAKLKGVDLKGANLIRAELNGASFTETDFGGADLSLAIIDENQIEYMESKHKAQKIRIMMDETGEIISYEEFLKRKNRKYENKA